VIESLIKPGEPFPYYRRTEPYIFVQFSAQEVCEKVMNGTFIATINNIQKMHHDKKLTILIEGFQNYLSRALKNNSRLEQRDAERILSQSQSSSSSQASKKKGKSRDGTEDQIRVSDKQIF